MKDLGEKINKEGMMYPTATEGKEPKVRYREFDLPLSVIEGLNLKVDDNVDIHIKGRVSGMQDTKWNKSVTFEAREGEVKKAGKKGESVLEEA